MSNRPCPVATAPNEIVRRVLASIIKVGTPGQKTEALEIEQMLAERFDHVPEVVNFARTEEEPKP